MYRLIPITVLYPLLIFVFIGNLRAASPEAPASDSGAEELQAGHSKHGEVFNEGPRQSAFLMEGMGDIKFEVTSDVPLVTKFIEQGIGQLHGFWYFEAERSFRQAAMLDPNCAMAYWGMALANANNDDRAKDFVEKALKLIDGASPREQDYITNLHEFLTGEGKKKVREANYVKAVTKMTQDYPDDLEAKALLGFLLYKYRSSADKTHAEVDVVLDEVLAKSKSHPVHHYRIHIWDQKSPQRALDSAAKCGPAASGIAHMWHMCGHIFSRVKRFGDAAWFQEASARVDHRHMMHDLVLPDQIHNFAHNNEWLIRNLMHVGRVHDALDLAKNMTELPRHPKYNQLSERNSASYGRERLLDVVERFELWDEAVALCHSPYLEPTEIEAQQVKRLRVLGKSYAKLSQVENAEGVKAELVGMLEDLKARPLEDDSNEADQDEDSTDDEASDEDDDKDKDKKPEDETKKRERELKKQKEKREREVNRIEEAIACIGGHLAVERKDYEAAIELLRKADEDDLTIAQVQLHTGEASEAIKSAEKHVKDRKNEVQPLAGLAEVCWRSGDHEKAREAFVRLRANSNWIDRGSDVFTRLEPMAVELGFPADWRVSQPPADDLGDQPELSSLGPFRWQPVPAPNWILPDWKGHLHSLEDYQGRPVIVVFYLGYGCLHCAEQLHALAPKTNDFAREGISIVAISSDELEGLTISQEAYEGEGERIPFPLIADPEKKAFKQYRCFDDFEDLPLHGTFLIDATGRVRWQDISYDPFMDVEFLLKESKRLLQQQTLNLNRRPKVDLAIRK